MNNLDLLRKWSEIEPSICKATFMQGTFEIVSPIDNNFPTASYVLKIGRCSEFERWYLLNSAIEFQCWRKNWFWMVSVPEMAESPFQCAIECRKTRKSALFSGSTRVEAFLQAYVAMLMQVGGDKNA